MSEVQKPECGATLPSQRRTALPCLSPSHTRQHVATRQVRSAQQSSGNLFPPYLRSVCWSDFSLQQKSLLSHHACSRSQTSGQGLPFAPLHTLTFSLAPQKGSWILVTVSLLSRSQLYHSYPLPSLPDYHPDLANIQHQPSCPASCSARSSVGF